MAKADVNNDGLEDIFIGGSVDNKAVMLLQNDNGKFIESSRDLWEKESGYEDVDALFFDLNNDGFQDLYVVSGGNEFELGSKSYLDRIYLNDGAGNFLKSDIKNKQAVSGSMVKSADFDGDGDLDLFVGGRLKPRDYPSPTSSMLLVNEGGELVDRTTDLASDLINIGMVTDAVWLDFDGDKDLDLIIAGEWMPITVIENKEGKFSIANVSGLDKSTGWWFSMNQGDFDNDGDMDIIVGNLGLNYKYQTSPEEPFDIYYNDFDGNGNYDIVLGYYNGDKHYPLRGFSCSSEQIPGLKEEIKKYDIFASMEIDDIYGASNLDKSLHYTADTFASSYIENLGNGSFKVTKLPRIAQISNINDMLVTDVNKDGNLDLIAVNNLFVSEIETPRNDAGFGLVLLGDGNGEFSPVRGVESGFIARGDAKGIIEMDIMGKSYILVANNGDRLQVFSLN